MDLRKEFDTVDHEIFLKKEKNSLFMMSHQKNWICFSAIWSIGNNEITVRATFIFNMYE